MNYTTTNFRDARGNGVTFGDTVAVSHDNRLTFGEVVDIQVIEGFIRVGVELEGSLQVLEFLGRNTLFVE